MKKFVRYCTLFVITSLFLSNVMAIKQVEHCISWDDGNYVFSSDEKGYLSWHDLKMQMMIKSHKSIEDISWLIKVPAVNRILIVHQQCKVSVAALVSDKIEIKNVNCFFCSSTFQSIIRDIQVSPSGKSAVILCEQNNSKYVRKIVNIDSDDIFWLGYELKIPSLYFKSIVFDQDGSIIIHYQNGGYGKYDERLWEV